MMMCKSAVDCTHSDEISRIHLRRPSYPLHKQAWTIMKYHLITEGLSHEFIFAITRLPNDVEFYQTYVRHARALGEMFRNTLSIRPPARKTGLINQTYSISIRVGGSARRRALVCPEPLILRGRPLTVETTRAIDPARIYDKRRR